MIQIKQAPCQLEPPPKVCEDLDEDCRKVKDKVACWLYNPAKGLCPYLGAA